MHYVTKYWWLLSEIQNADDILWSITMSICIHFLSAFTITKEDKSLQMKPIQQNRKYFHINRYLKTWICFYRRFWCLQRVTPTDFAFTPCIQFNIVYSIWLFSLYNEYEFLWVLKVRDNKIIIHLLNSDVHKFFLLLLPLFLKRS